jgi:hypothetical protein
MMIFINEIFQQLAFTATNVVWKYAFVCNLTTLIGHFDSVAEPCHFDRVPGPVPVLVLHIIFKKILNFFFSLTFL